MWKIKIEYQDKSKLTLTGKHKDIPFRLALKYYNELVSGRICKSVYQQYPKKDYPEIDLYEKLLSFLEQENEMMEGIKL